MTYQFAGFFAKPAITKPRVLPDGAVWRVIESPFSGVGVYLPALVGKSPPVPEIMKLAHDLGIDTVEDWMLLVYDCWAGRIEHVHCFVSRDQREFGPLTESSDLKTA